MRTTTVGIVMATLFSSGCGGAGPTPENVNTTGTTGISQPSLAGTGDCARQDGQLGPLPIAGVREGSSVALAKTAAGTIAYVADEDSRAIHSVDIRNGLTLSTTSLDAAPAQLLVLADGRVAVTLRDRNRVQIFEPRRDASQPLAPLCRVKAPG